MAASFHIDYPGSAGDFILNATKAIKGKGGIFSGDEQTGSFSIKTLIGTIKGNYEVLNQKETASQVAITITQKPPLVPMSKIKSVIADNL
jgi:hypothetical protein